MCGADKKGRKRRKKPSSAGVQLGVSARLPPPRWGCISGRQSDWEGPGVKATQERRPEPLSAIPKPVTLPSPSTCSVLRALRPPRRGCRARSPSPPPQPHGSMASTVSGRARPGQPHAARLLSILILIYIYFFIIIFLFLFFFFLAFRGSSMRRQLPRQHCSPSSPRHTPL